MSKKIKRYSILILFCCFLSLFFHQAPVGKLLSLMDVHTIESLAYAQNHYRSFDRVVASSSGINPHAATDDNGYVYIAYEGSANFIKSMDNGTTFPTTAVISSATGWFPRIAIDNAQEAYALYTWQSGTVYFPAAFKSTHPGGTYTFSEKQSWNTWGNYDGGAEIAYTDIAVENISGTDNIYAVSEDNATSPGNWHIYFSASTDGGTTWSDASTTTVSASAGARYPVIAVKKSEENDVYTAWVNTSSNAVMFDYSTNGGGAWVGDAQLDSGSAVDPQRPGLAASSISGTGWIFCVWTDNRNGNKDVYFDYSLDGGATWHGTDVKLGNSSYAAYSQDQPSIAVRPGTNHIYAVWRDNRDGSNRIYFQEATYVDETTGFRWGIDDDASGTVDADEAGDDKVVYASGNHDTPTVVASANGEVYVVWHGGSIDCARYNPTATEGPESSETGVPNAPTGLTATAGNNTVALDWDDNSEADIDYYNIYRSTTRGTWTLLASTTTSASAYTDSSATNGTAYWYVVTAVDIDANESGYSGDARATPNNEDTTVPDAPTNLQASGGDSIISLNWDEPAATDLSKYHVYRGTNTGGAYSYVAEVEEGDRWYFDSGLTNGITYYYVVTSLDTSNNESADSSEANAVSGGGGTGLGSAPGAPPAGTIGGGGPGGGCFIATACYGSSLAGEVRVLSDFRDRYMVKNTLGRAFVKAYYRVSPPVAGIIGKHPALRKIARIYLAPLVKLAKFVVE